MSTSNFDRKPSITEATSDSEQITTEDEFEGESAEEMIECSSSCSTLADPDRDPVTDPNDHADDSSQINTPDDTCDVFVVSNDVQQIESTLGEETTEGNLLEAEELTVNFEDVSETATDLSNLAFNSVSQLSLFLRGYRITTLQDTSTTNSVTSLSEAHVECSICFEQGDLKHQISKCCSVLVCYSCLSKYFEEEMKVNNRTVFNCIQGCSARENVYIVEEVLTVLKSLNATEIMKTYNTLRTKHNLKNDEIQCFSCSNVIIIDLDKVKIGRKTKKLAERALLLKVQCMSCFNDNCASCGTPWSPSHECASIETDKELFKKWTHGLQDSVVGRCKNARKCPGCKTVYQKSDGCNHMTCSRCGQQFCYACGGRYFKSRLSIINWLTNHNTELSVFGCKKNLLPGKPILRRTVRGSVLVGAIAVSPVVATGVVVSGLAVLPVYGGVRLVSAIRKR